MAALVSLVVAMLSFQVGASVAKQLIPLVGAPATTALRLGISALVLIVLRRPWRTWPPRHSVPVLVAYGLSLGTMNFVFYQALRTIPLGIAVGLVFTGPLTVAILHSHRRSDYAWVLCAAIGLGCLLPLTRMQGRLDPAGVLVFGTLPDLWVPVTNFVVTPVLAWWERPTPVAAVDPAEVSAITTALAGLEKERVVEENPPSLKEFTLDPPRISITFHAAGDSATHRVDVGVKTPMGAELYAKVEGQPAVFLIGSYREDALNKSLFNLRDKTVLTFDRESANALKIEDRKSTRLNSSH